MRTPALADLPSSHVAAASVFADLLREPTQADHVLRLQEYFPSAGMLRVGRAICGEFLARSGRPRPPDPRVDERILKVRRLLEPDIAGSVTWRRPIET